MSSSLRDTFDIQTIVIGGAVAAACVYIAKSWYVNPILQDTKQQKEESQDKPQTEIDPEPVADVSNKIKTDNTTEDIRALEPKLQAFRCENPILQVTKQHKEESQDKPQTEIDPEPVADVSNKIKTDNTTEDMPAIEPKLQDFRCAKEKEYIVVHLDHNGQIRRYGSIKSKNHNLFMRCRKYNLNDLESKKDKNYVP